jgi:sulfoxide reductase heme-binding subunit YedZ
MQASYRLLNNSRFYILVSTVLLSIIIASLVRMDVPSDQLFAIRTEQLYGLLCIFYWYTALVISPVGYVIGKQRMKRVEFARRAIGVSAAYFAMLHAGVALWGQLGGFGGLSTLSSLYKWSLLAGLVGVIVLFLLAITSFDKVITFMSFRRWKWLHRLVYAGGILAVLHIWSLGTHLASGFIQYVAFLALVILAGLEMYRVACLVRRKDPALPKQSFYSLFGGLWLIWIALICMVPIFVKTFRSEQPAAPAIMKEHNHHESH